MTRPEVAGGVDLLDEQARRQLEASLLPGEVVEFVLLASRAKASSPTKDILAALEDRFLVVRRGAVARSNPITGGGTETVAFYYRDVNGLDLQKKLLTASIRIDRAGFPLPPEIIIDKGRLEEYRPFIERINAKVQLAKRGGTPAAASAPPTRDLVSELERLARLRDSGALTEEEFQKAKDLLLG